MQTRGNLADLTDASAVRRAMAEFDELGRDEFLRRYGYGPAKRYFIREDGREYDSKAIAGVAVGFQHPQRGPLRSGEFSGGEGTVKPQLERLGFTIVERDATQASNEVSLSSLFQEACELLRRREDGSDFVVEDLDQIITKIIPSKLQQVVGDQIAVRGRTRIGSLADVPWVGLFLSDQEASAQRGYYLVYLFAKDGSATFLTLNMGTERVKGGLEVLHKRALDLRRVAGPHAELLTEIDLRSQNQRPKRYEAGTAYAYRYDPSVLPLDDQLVHDLRKMIEILEKIEKSGLIWDPEKEPIHLLFKWNADREPRTIDLHREIASREGSVWWGRFSASSAPSIAQSKLVQLQDQLATRVETHAYVYRRGSLWRAVVQEATVDPPPHDDPRFPTYYRPEDCNFFVRLSDWEELAHDWLPKNVVLASHPDADPDRMASALTNQTTPLFVFELAGPQPPKPPVDGGETIDISNITLADVSRNVADHFVAAGLDYGARHGDLLRSALVSLATKRFLLLTGLSGSGKTRLGIGVGQWFGPDRWLLIPVRPDWTGPESIFGYENGLSTSVDGRFAWSAPPTLQFILKAARDADSPYLLILDEMNLAHVERYFADVLSGMESKTSVVPNVSRNGPEWRLMEPTHIPFPENLFVVGTVNIDETTYMFSPKVLDRANTLEFRVRTEDLQPNVVPPADIEAGHPTLVRRFLHAATTVAEEDWEAKSQLAEWLQQLHRFLSDVDREFGHRVFYEAIRFGFLFAEAGEEDPLKALDLQVLQKVLPRFNGSIREIGDALNLLGDWCWKGPGDYSPSPSFDPIADASGSAVLPFSFDKIRRMTRRLRANHFVGFAE